MPLPRPPQLMTEDELLAWVRDTIRRQTPESDQLDYKAAISIGRREERIELARDVSSFANERGGVLLYGVPEDRGNGVPMPRPLEECGIDMPARLPEDMENILLETIEPVLPELFIRPLVLPEIAPRALLMVHHPASWNRPHMVARYDQGRYYRRGNYRAVLMREREVEAAYAMRGAAVRHAQEFFDSADFGAIPAEERFLRVIVCPHFTLVRREAMRERQFREWLEANNPAGRRGDWIPFLDGVRFVSYTTGGLRGLQFEVGCFTLALSRSRRISQIFFATDSSRSTGLG